jgi:hypothetical protein
MKWDPSHQSSDVEDRRGQISGGGGGLGFLIALLLRTRYGWIIVLLLLGGYLVQHFFLAPRTGDQTKLSENDTDAHFVAFVLDDTQQYWQENLQGYRRAKLVLFTNATDTACGYGQSATGPFYCPGDENVYIDLGFFRALDQMGAQGDFARAYVIAHEIGHHVQNVLGQKVRGSARGPEGGSVRMELQADCYAGMWARSASDRHLLEPGDLQEALRAASRIGDDVLQREETGRVRPESFTHGTSVQRFTWLKRGYDEGRLESCDTFRAPAL